jgi:hypothetical protein
MLGHVEAINQFGECQKNGWKSRFFGQMIKVLECRWGSVGLSGED